jgi:hypothetical protein
MRAPDHEWTQFLLAAAKGQLREVTYRNKLGFLFGSTVIEDPDSAHALLCEGIQPDQLFPLTRQRIILYLTNQLMNEVNDRIQQWRAQTAPYLGKVSAFTELIRLLGNSVAFSRYHQIDFLERIETSDLRFHELSILHGHPFILIPNIDASVGLVNGRWCSASALQNRMAVPAG